MIHLLELPDRDVKLLTNGKIIPCLGIRDPYKMHRLRTEARLTKTKCKPAIYFLFLNRELVYIGKCTSLKDRLLDHIRGREHLKAYRSKYDGKWRGERTIPPKEFDTFSKLYITLPSAEQVEPIYIAHFRPVLNKVGVDQPAEQLDIFNY